ncbi:hypothetical protein JCM3770_001649 [Rhodotorula araucariae]
MATPNERIVFAAKQDAVDMLEEVINGTDEYDLNYQDGLGNTALHYAVSSPSPDALTLLLDLEPVDVDLQNRLDRATPLHLAVKLENEAARHGVVEMLLDAGADPNIKDRHGLKPADYLHPDRSETDKAIQQAIRVALADRILGGTKNNADLANDDDDDDGEPGSGSESD